MIVSVRLCSLVFVSVRLCLLSYVKRTRPYDHGRHSGVCSFVSTLVSWEKEFVTFMPLRPVASDVSGQSGLQVIFDPRCHVSF